MNQKTIPDTVLKICGPVLFFLLCLSFSVSAQQDIRDRDNISCIGNGNMAVYIAKADILQVFGPPYSSPSLLQMFLQDTSIRVVSRRQKGTAIWTHSLLHSGEEIGTMVDVMDSTSPVFIRKFNLRRPLTFTLHFAQKIFKIPNTSSYSAFQLNDAVLAESPRGVPFYNDYPMPFRQYLQLAATGNAHIQLDSMTGNTLRLESGEGYLYLIAGPSYPECISNSLRVFQSTYAAIFSGAVSSWKIFTARRKNFEQILPASVPDRALLLDAIDAVAINCKTQQSREGGVLAGHNYHLGYVRDQYGVARGLLKMGYYAEAKAILNFFWKRWQAKGLIHNAQGIGIDIFHVHENDEVEITGYLIVQAFDYLEKSKDTAYLREIFPMLKWAFEAQEKNLARNMLPFNGDETYIAGGILPRSCMVDGSAEATLLFITGGNKLVDFARKYGRWNAAELTVHEKNIQQATAHFRGNFYMEGQLYCNNTSRSEGLILPPFRHGVCEGLGPGCEFYGWTQKNANNRYLCPVCFTTMQLPKTVPERHLIRSVSMMPLYIGSDMFTKKEMQGLIGIITENYQKSGKLPSRPDGDITVGYDYGLLLFNLIKLQDPLQKEIYRKMLSVLDETGAWVEYYENGKPMGTRYRPWESGINIEAAIDYAETVK